MLNIDSGLPAILSAMQAGFQGVNERLDGVDRRLGGIDGRLDGIDGLLDGVDRRFDAVDIRFDGIEREIKDLKSSTSRIAVDLVKTNDRLSRLETYVMTQTTTKADFQRISSLVVAFNARMEAYKRETYTFPAALDVRGQILQDHERRIKRIETDQA